jgi:hypothetical protein
VQRHGAASTGFLAFAAIENEAHLLAAIMIGDLRQAFARTAQHPEQTFRAAILCRMPRPFLFCLFALTAA